MPVLQDQHCDCLDKVLQKAAELRGLLEQCKACGLDTAHAEEELNAREQLAKSIKKTFFPHRP